MVFGLDDAALAIGAGATIANTVGGFMGGQQQGLSTNDQRWLADFNWKQSLRNEDFQHQLATSGIQMRVDDAVKAGLSPLVGAGVQPYQGNIATPVSDPGGSDAPPAVAEGLKRFGQSGQDLSRAIMAKRSQQDRKLMDANIRRAQADADIAESQALNAKRALAGQPGLPPPAPGSMSNPLPLVYYYKTPSGRVVKMPSPEAAASSMGEPFGKWDVSTEMVSDSVGSGRFGGIGSVPYRSTNYYRRH